MAGRVRVVVVGAGFGGIGTAAALLKHGTADVTVLERADDVGGVWRDNTYPGAACDVPSPLYSYSWAPNPHWSRFYSGQAEILTYLHRTADAAGVRDLVRTGVTVTGARWDDGARVWRVSAEGLDDTEGGELECDVLVTALGQLSEPVVPALPGAETFAGPAFHSARWRHDIEVTGKRVAVVGTGASAIQFVPHLAEDVVPGGSVTVFQRSAPYVVPKIDHAATPLHHTALEALPPLLLAGRGAVFAASEGLNFSLGSPRALRVLGRAFEAHLKHQVPDPELRERLRPSDPLGCKRILFSNDWYPTLTLPQVEVVDGRRGSGGAIERIEPDGVRTADGTLHPADVLVWGTGFAATDFLADLDITGRDGVGLHEAWRDGARAYLGLTMPGFPNFFSIYGPNTNLGGSSIIAMLEAQAEHVSGVVDALASGAMVAAEVREPVLEGWDEEIQGRLAHSVWAGCDSWYREDSGRISTNWPGLVTEYRRRTRTPDLADYR